MLSILEIDNAKTKLLFITHIVIFSELIEYYLKDKDIFTQSWLYSSFSFLLAYIIFIIFSNNINNFNKNNYSIISHENNFLKFTILFIASHIIKNYLENGIITINYLYLMRIIIIIIGYVLPDYIFQEKLLKLNKHQYLIYDIIKMFITDCISALLVFNVLTINDFYESFSFLSSYVIWEIIISKLIKNI